MSTEKTKKKLETFLVKDWKYHNVSYTTIMNVLEGERHVHTTHNMCRIVGTLVLLKRSRDFEVPESIKGAAL